jgi:hypothetical protein
MIKYIHNEKGVALVISLLMVFVSLAIIVGVLMMLNQGQKVSSLTRQYATAREAAYGGAEFTALEIIRKEIDDAGGTAAASAAWAKSGTYGGLVSHSVAENCFYAKLTTSTALWPAACGDTSTTNLDVTSDFSVTLSGTQSKAPFTVFVKIVDTRRGNTSLSSVVLERDPTNSINERQHLPYIYRIEYLTQRTTNPDERAVLSGVMTW